VKILIGTHHYPPSYVAGVELITRRVAGWLRDHGHTVEVVCVEEIDSKVHATVRTEIQDDIRVHRLGLRLAGMGEHLGVRFRDDELARWFAAYLASWQPDVLHSQSSYVLSASLVETAKRSGVPVVATLHDYWYLCPRLTLLRSDGSRCTRRASPRDCTRCILGESRRYRFVDKVDAGFGKRLGWARRGRGPLVAQLNPLLLKQMEQRQVYLDEILRTVDQIVIPAPFTRELLLERGFDPAQIRLIRYGLDSSRWYGLPRIQAAAGLRIGYLGQLAPHKGVHLLIEALRGLTVRDDRRPQLKIYGNPASFPKYSARLRALAGHDPRIEFCGPYDNDRAEAILADIDVLVVPSLWFEISPLVIMEAFSAKVPVVATDVPNLQYQVRHGIDGLLFAPDDAADLRRQLQRLVDDPALVERLVGGIQPVRSVDEEMAELEDVYRRLTAGRADRVADSNVGSIAG
jgi:glycosyltransferase involved in cell wall biosynthesis